MVEFILYNLPLFLGIGFVATIGGAVFLWRTGYIHRLMDWFRPASDKFVPAKVFCEDKQIRDRKLKVERYAVSDLKKFRSFYLVHDLLLASPSGNDKFLPLTERSARPIDFHNKITPDEWGKYPSAQTVFIDTTADIRSESSREATSSFMAQSLTIMALCAAIIVVVFGIIVFAQTRAG